MELSKVHTVTFESMLDDGAIVPLPTAVYVGGPMRGFPRFNFHVFDSLADALRARYIAVFNPADHDRQVNPGCEEYPGFDEGDLVKYHEHCNDVFEKLMTWDLTIICNEIDALVLLPGWENSTGSKMERFVAESVGLPIWLAVQVPGGGWRLQIDPEQKRLNLTMEQLSQTPWGEMARVRGHKEREALPVAQKDTPSGSEERITNALTGGQKGNKVERFDLIPVAPLTDLAKLYGVGANKYAERNWEQGYDWNLSYAAALRHLTQFWAGEDIDPETGVPHPINVVFHMFALVEWLRTHPELDNRPCESTTTPQGSTAGEA